MADPVGSARDRELHACSVPEPRDDSNHTKVQGSDSRSASERLDAYVEGGMCGNGASEKAGVTPLVSTLPKKSQQEVAAERTRSVDLPLEDDPVGNAIVGGAATGWLTGVGVIAGAAKSAAKAGAKEVAKQLVKEVVVRSVGVEPAPPGNADPHTGKVPPPYVPSPAVADEALVCRGPIRS